MNAVVGTATADPREHVGLTDLRESAELIRVGGLVQGVGFRPTVWRLAQRYGMRGTVANDGQGVSIHVCGAAEGIDAFVQALTQEAPPLARVDRIEREPATLLPSDAAFRIIASAATQVHTGVVPDAATCPDCVREIFDPFSRHYRYPFTNCTHCGPRLSLIKSIPYDRASTTMRPFDMCPACRTEYENPGDRRFHAQPVACHTCGPRAWLERADGAAIALDSLTTLDAVDAVCSLLQRGEIVAIKGLGGFQLACDATNEGAVARLRERKRRERKPFALMARNIDIVRQYCAINAAEEALLQSPAAPIVLLDLLMNANLNENSGVGVAASVAPGLHVLGFMLPNTPLHHLMLRRMTRPIVLTSGNLADEPQAIDNNEAKQRVSVIADYFLLHDRDIARRVDDSVMRVAAGAPRVLRRARGLAPATIAMPPGFDAAPPVLALGGELKNTFCLLQKGQATVSHHMGDLENALTYADYRCAMDDYMTLFEHAPRIVAVDPHPEYLSSKLGREMVEQAVAHLPGGSLTLEPVQHHHAHIAACLAENGIALDTAPVLGVALDGLGYGEDGALWDGEFCLADYLHCQRLATFTRELLDSMLDACMLADEDDELAYPFRISRLKTNNMPYIEPLGMWQALLGDLILRTPVGVISARFHKGLAIVIARMVDKLSRFESPDEPIKTVALSGCVFQNRVLLEQVVMRLQVDGFRVLTHRLVPTNDGGLSLGQAAVAAARALQQ